MNGRIQENLHTQDNFEMSHLEIEKPMLSNVRVPDISGFSWHKKSTSAYESVSISSRNYLCKLKQKMPTLCSRLYSILFSAKIYSKEWGGIIDLTVEFPESCRKSTKYYLSAPTWDGVPLSPADLESAAIFAVQAREKGDVLVHCAHGRGRSTTVMCACLIKAGLFSNWEEAFEKGIKPYRSVCKLNQRMMDNLAAWQAQYVDGKKSA